MTTNSHKQHQQSILPRSLPRQIGRYGFIVLQVLILWRLSVIELWPLALIILFAVELRASLRRLSIQTLVQATSQLLVGIAAILMIAIFPRAISQIAVAVVYLATRVWLNQYSKREAERNLITTLVCQALIFESIFLMAAVWDTPKIVILMLVWAAAYAGAYHLLTQRQERTAIVLAASWALIATEVAWVTLSWLVSYTILGGYLIVPQPAIILTVLAYSFGSIYLAQRQNKLGRRRLAEYLMIGLTIILVVIAGTTWKGSI